MNVTFSLGSMRYNGETDLLAVGVAKEAAPG